MNPKTFERKLENQLDEREPPNWFWERSQSSLLLADHFNEKRSNASQLQRTKKHGLRFGLLMTIGGLSVHFILHFILAITHDLC